MQGWIKLHRDLMDKPIWIESTPEQKVILITLLMMASHKERKWEWQGKPYTIEPGQFITSLESIAQKSGKGISVQNVRTALKRFEKYEFLTNKSTNKNRLITIVNWGIYQADDDTDNKQPHKRLTGTSQAVNNYQELKNVENEKEQIPYAEIINYLNEKAGKNFSNKSVANKKLISGRFNEGRNLTDFKHVIDIKCGQWKESPKMNKYLRPETLFSQKNFENYVNEKPLQNKQSQSDPRDIEIEFQLFIANGGDPNEFDWAK